MNGGFTPGSGDHLHTSTQERGEMKPQTEWSERKCVSKS
jgi:hypothetical protein